MEWIMLVIAGLLKTKLLHTVDNWIVTGWKRGYVKSRGQIKSRGHYVDSYLVQAPAESALCAAVIQFVSDYK